MTHSLLLSWVLMSVSIYLLLRPHGVHRLFGGVFLALSLLQMSLPLSEDGAMTSFCLIAACLALAGVIGSVPFMNNDLKTKTRDSQEEQQ